ncbi:MAG: hypothetical protein ACRCZF_13840 [Gemmataceae bacterium]
MEITEQFARIEELLLRIENALKVQVVPHTLDVRADGARVRYSKHGRRPSGRRVETLEIALHAEELRSQGRSWKEILTACRQRWPNDRRVRNAEQIRATHRRLLSHQTTD